MNEAELEEMQEDRLANFAVAAFLMLTVPDYSGLVIFAFMSGLLALSLLLATASLVAPLQRWGLATTRSVALIMLSPSPGGRPGYVAGSVSSRSISKQIGLAIS